MTEGGIPEVRVSVDQTDAPRLGLWSRASSWRWPTTWSWEPAVAALGIVGAIAALRTTLRANFLAYPGWLGVQKADFILGPIGVGLYWYHKRPNNRLGLLLIALGLLSIPYVLESSSDPTLFALGVEAEFLPYVMLMIVILAFPSDRLKGRPEWLVIALLLASVAVFFVVTLTTSNLAPGFSISGCRVACPRTGFGLLSPRYRIIDSRVLAAISPAIALAAVGVIVWRFVTGTPPRRRALAIGAPIAVLFLLSHAGYYALFLFAPNGLTPSAPWIHDILQWSVAATRSLVWYGFLFALIAAELFAGRVLRDVVRRSVGRPSLGELEAVLREPLGDPGLRLGFWRASTGEWIGHGGAGLEPPEPGQALTTVDRDGRPAVAIVHDAQLSEDPELLQAAGAAALLARENAELEAAWQESLRELTDSRARLASASERERRKLERDLHDGTQQHLVAATINLTLADEADEERELRDRIADSRSEIEQALIELREVSHGIYPTELARSGLSRAFDRLARRYPRLNVSEAKVGRSSPEIELAVYYCGLEAVQNASKHAGPEAGIWIRLYVEADQLQLEVGDNGRGFDVPRARHGVGLQNMRDRLAAVGGHIDVLSKPGEGTLVVASVPVSTPPHDPAGRNGSDARAAAGAHTR